MFAPSYPSSRVRFDPSTITPYEILEAIAIPPLHFPRPKSIAALNGLRYEHQISRALISSGALYLKDFKDFQREFEFRKSISHLSLEQNSITFIHNPWFKYKIKDEIKFHFCSPDFLILYSSKIESTVKENRDTVKLNTKSTVKKTIYCEKDLCEKQIAEKNTVKNNTVKKSEKQSCVKNQIIILESKLSYTDSAYIQLYEKYKPICEKILNTKVKVLVVCKHLNPNSPHAENSIISALRLNPPLMQYLGMRSGDGKLRF